MKKISVRDLFNIQSATKLQIEGIENHCDLISTNILMTVIYLSKLLPTLGLQALGEGNVKPTEVLSTCAKILEHVFLLCNACNTEVPDEKELLDFESSIPIQIKNDSVMTVLSMIEAMVDIAHIINVDLDQPIWGEDEVPEEFEVDIFRIIIGIKHLGDKFSFTIDDVLEKLTD